MKKKLFVIMATALCTVLCCAAFAACGDNTDKADGSEIVAQGTAFQAHSDGGGYGGYFLYQERADGIVNLYVIVGGGQTSAIPVYNYNANVKREIDKDGDPSVTLTITGYTVEIDEVYRSHFPDKTTFSDGAKTANATPDSAAPYEYSMSIYWEVNMGSISERPGAVNVAPISDANKLIDVNKWKSETIDKCKKSHQDFVDANKPSGGDEDETKPVASFLGEVGDAGGVTAQLVLNKDYKATVIVGYYVPTRGSFAMTYVTQTGIWNFYRNNYVILMNTQFETDKEDQTGHAISEIYMTSADSTTGVYSDIVGVKAERSVANGCDKDEILTYTLKPGEVTAAATNTACTAFVYDNGQSSVGVTLYEGGSAIVHSGMYTQIDIADPNKKGWVAVYTALAGKWTKTDDVFTLTVGDKTYTSTKSGNTYSFENVTAGDHAGNVTYTPAA